jgi:hypothetical protein
MYLAAARVADVHGDVLLDDIEGQETQQDEHAGGLSQEAERVGCHVKERGAQQHARREAEKHAELRLVPATQEREGHLSGPGYRHTVSDSGERSH